jgi:DNA-binding CsgD family transcriptional regulator
MDNVMRRDMLRLLMDGLSDKEIASQMGATLHSVHWHVKGLYQCLGVHSRSELIARLHSSGLPAL